MSKPYFLAAVVAVTSVVAGCSSGGWSSCFSRGSCGGCCPSVQTCDPCGSCGGYESYYMPEDVGIEYGPAPVLETLPTPGPATS
jgi:hypothetical protein